FLFDQSLLITLYQVGAAVCVTAAMVGMNQLQTRVRPVASLRIAAGLILQALPLTLVVFLLFPRIAPLWSIPVPSAASTGLSDKLTPGDVARLGRSDELAFRVVFDGNVPNQRDLYWRGLVYSDFSRGTWTIADPLPQITAQNTGQGRTLTYEIFLEPTQSKWLYALDTPIRYPSRVDLLGDYRLVNPEPVLSVMRYQVETETDYVMDAELPAGLLARETALPPSDSPRMRQYAERLYAQTGSAEAMVAAMLNEIRSEPYVYTLNPPTLNRLDSIDQFWFDTRRGFCTHYAGAVTFALRSVGIPARMVGGYQGGEVNPLTGHMVVRQYDAHAWIEVWLAGRGWTRFDPTSAVAPQRVESGLDAALNNEDRASLPFFSAARLADQGLLNNLLRWTDSLEYRWNLWVVGYDTATQSDVLKRLLGAVNALQIGLAMIIGSALSLLLVAAAVFWRRRPKARHPVERIFLRFCRSIRDPRLQRGPAETPMAYLSRLSHEVDMDIAPLQSELQELLYDPQRTLSLQERYKLQQNLRKLRFKLAFNTPTTAS
ncbi:MAG: transglutaminaseTgpA domain-containing protein, partial [Pseudomonadota bacterium]